MKACRGSGIIAPFILNSAIGGGHFTTQPPPPLDTASGTEGTGIIWAPEPVKSFWRKGQSNAPAGI